ncbi:MAG: hypothetical protein ACFE68_05555 [Candidatus Hodarchaeota archaeon]
MEVVSISNNGYFPLTMVLLVVLILGSSFSLLAPPFSSPQNSLKEGDFTAKSTSLETYKVNIPSCVFQIDIDERGTFNTTLSSISFGMSELYDQTKIVFLMSHSLELKNLVDLYITVYVNSFQQGVVEPKFPAKNVEFQEAVELDSFHLSHLENNLTLYVEWENSALTGNNGSIKLLETYIETFEVPNIEDFDQYEIKMLKDTYDVLTVFSNQHCTFNTKTWFKVSETFSLENYTLIFLFTSKITPKWSISNVYFDLMLDGKTSTEKAEIDQDGEAVQVNVSTGALNPDPQEGKMFEVPVKIKFTADQKDTLVNFSILNGLLLVSPEQDTKDGGGDRDGGDEGFSLNSFPPSYKYPKHPVFVFIFLLVFFLPFRFAKRPELTPPLSTEEELKLAKGEELYDRTEVGKSGDMID